jgi:hypothetical protein
LVRPNPIAYSIIELLAIDGTTLQVRGLDCLNRTPLIDLKPERGAVSDWRHAEKLGCHSGTARKGPGPESMNSGQPIDFLSLWFLDSGFSGVACAPE